MKSIIIPNFCPDLRCFPPMPYLLYDNGDDHHVARSATLAVENLKQKVGVVERLKGAIPIELNMTDEQCTMYTQYN